MQPLNLVMGTTKYDECTLQSISHFNDCNLNFSDKEKKPYILEVTGWQNPCISIVCAEVNSYTVKP